MNREKAKELADILTAYANGADLQYEARNEWTDMKDGDAIVFCIEHGREMRVKQKYNEIFKLKSLLEENHREELEVMSALRHRYIKYTDDLKAEIIRLCNADKLDELKTLIEENLK